MWFTSTPLSYLLSSLDALYHGALRFITDCTTHHCVLYERVAWPPLRIRRKMHWHLLIYKAILGHLPNYLCCFIQRTLFGNHSLRSQSNYNLCVSFVRTELGKTSFKYAAASDWNLLQKQMKLQNLVSYNYLKSLLCNLESNLTVCNCFWFVTFVVTMLFICIHKLGCLSWPGRSWKRGCNLSESFPG